MVFSETVGNTYRTTSTAPGLTFGSLPMIETLAVNEPSIEKTTTLVWGGNTSSEKSVNVWSPLQARSLLIEV